MARRGGTSGLRARLVLEILEDRTVPSLMRIGAWNTANHPNNAADDASFKTIIEAIGAETVQSAAKRLDVLAVCETDTTSANKLDDLFDEVYTTTTFEVAMSTADGGGDRTAFVYDTSTVSLLGTFQVPGALQHTLLRGQFRPVGTNGGEDFYVYAIHLKSGSSGADVTARAAEAAVLRADADGLGDGAHVIFAGDFNMNVSSEGAWGNMLAPGNAQTTDVADTPGDWASNPAYKHVHSHATHQMRKRFDILFATGELRDGAGLDYVPSSFHVFANNNTHALDGAITTGTGAAPNVLSALVDFSDHLPIVADFQFGGAAAVLNEVYVDPPSADDAREYVEIRSLVPGAALTDVWLIEIDGDNTAAGIVDNAQNLSSLATGSNGLLILGQNYTSGTPWNGSIPAATVKGDLLGGAIENGAVTFLLVKDFSGSVGNDLDTNDDGVIDGTWWSTLVDGVGWSDGTAGDRVYSTAVLSTSSTPPQAATRFPTDTSASSAPAWYYGSMSGSGTTTTYGAGSANMPPGAVITPGASNFGGGGPVTKFFVVDTTADDTFEYDASGQLVTNYNLGAGNTSPRGAAAHPSGSHLWVVDANLVVYKYDDAGTLLGQWTASGLVTPEGIATDGTNLWIVDRGTDLVYFYASGAALTSGTHAATSSFAVAAGNTNAMGIVTDGTSLWTVNAATTDRVYKYTTAGTALGNWAIDAANANPTGLTIDPSDVNHIWIVDSTTDSVYQYDNAAGLTAGSLNASVVWALAGGNSSPQDIADPPVAEGGGADVAPAAGEASAGFDMSVLADGLPDDPWSAPPQSYRRTDWVDAAFAAEDRVTQWAEDEPTDTFGFDLFAKGEEESELLPAEASAWTWPSLEA